MSSDRDYIIGTHGLQIGRDLTYDEWLELGEHIARRIEGYSWALGDWLAEGGRLKERQRHTDGRWKKCSLYAEAKRITGYDSSTLSNAFSVASSFPRDQRVVGLTWTHHRMAMQLPVEKRVPMLQLAVKNKWNTTDFKDMIDTEMVVAGSQGEAPRPAPANSPHHSFVKCPECGHEFSVKGHKVRRARGKKVSTDVPESVVGGDSTGADQSLHVLNDRDGLR